MTPLDLNAIYNLIPAVYRIRDAELAAPNQAGPLQSLVAILAEQIEVLQESLYQAYDDQFIETCQEWVVPYIGNLVGVSGLADFPGTPYSLREAVADTIANRRRKGTVSGLESIARDVTGWPAHVVEYFQLLATTQFMNHIRPANLSWTCVRKIDNAMLGTPFDVTTHTADVRNIATAGGKYNIPNIGIWLWRLEPMELENSPAFQLDSHRFLFDPLGRDTQLFTNPQPVDETSGRSTPLNVPMPISRRMLYGNVADYSGQDLSFFIQQPSLGALPVHACNLSDVLDSGGHITGWAHTPKNSIVVDPVLGRIAFPATADPNNVRVNYTYAFSAEIGGGPYSRPFDDTANLVINVPGDASTIALALAAAAAAFAGGDKSVVILIGVNDRFIETPVVDIPANCSLEIRAGDKLRPVLVLSGDLNVYGGPESSFSLNGLLVSGGCINVPLLNGANPNGLTTLTISHCTLAPIASPAIPPAPAQAMGPRIVIEAADVSLELDHSITGPLRIASSCNVSIEATIVDAGSQFEIAYANENCTASGAPLTVTNTTFIGQVHARQIVLASNVIFLALTDAADMWTTPVSADQLQQGCVRYSYVPPGSRVPRPYNCYPGPNTTAPLVPAFTSLRFGDAGYCQLARESGAAILTGADDQSEMGAFHDLYQPQRIANLQISLNDYLRFGLEAGVFYAT